MEFSSGLLDSAQNNRFQFLDRPMIGLLQSIDIILSPPCGFNAHFDRGEFELQKYHVRQQPCQAAIIILKRVNPEKSMVCPGKKVHKFLQKILVGDGWKVLESFSEIKTKILHEFRDTVKRRRFVVGYLYIDLPKSSSHVWKNPGKTNVMNLLEQCRRNARTGADGLQNKNPRSSYPLNFKWDQL